MVMVSRSQTAMANRTRLVGLLIVGLKMHQSRLVRLQVLAYRKVTKKSEDISFGPGDVLQRTVNNCLIPAKHWQKGRKPIGNIKL